MQGIAEELNEYKEGFYSTKYYLSPSALSKYLWRPKAWYDWYILNQREEKEDSKAKIEGSLIHLLILEPEKFDEKYCVSAESTASDSLVKVINRVFKYAKLLVETEGGQIGDLTEYRFLILDAMMEENYFQKLNSDESRVEKVTTEKGLEYWDHLKKMSGKILISPETYHNCKRAAESILSNDYIRLLLGIDEEVEVLNEIMVKLDLNEYKFGFKGIIDNLVVDDINKIVRINDIKTTSKTLEEFVTGSIEFFSYDLQLALYAVIVTSLKGELFEKGYKLETNFIVISPYGDVGIVSVQEGTLLKWILKLKDKVEAFNWNFTQKDFTYSKAFRGGVHTI